MSNQNIAPLRPPMTAAGMIGLPVAIQIPQSHQSAPFNNNNSYSSTPHSSSSQLLRPPSENGQDGTQRKKGNKLSLSTKDNFLALYFYYNMLSCVLLCYYCLVLAWKLSTCSKVKQDASILIWAHFNMFKGHDNMCNIVVYFLSQFRNPSKSNLKVYASI